MATAQLIEEQVRHVQRFTDDFWLCVRKRTALTHLSSTTACFSEAPAEGVFSVVERVMEGRECLGLDVVEALTRIALQGPGVATDAAYTLSASALKKRPTGERYTTDQWMKGMKSKALIEIQAGKR